MDSDGNLYVGGNGHSTGGTSSALDQSIRFIDYNTGYVTTFAGGQYAGFTNGEFAIPSYAGGINNTISGNSSPVRFSAPTGGLPLTKTGRYMYWTGQIT